MYGFKVREPLTALGASETKSLPIEDVRFRHRQEAADAASYASARSQLYESRHISLLLKLGEKAFLRLHHGYKLPGKSNAKLFNQRTGPFTPE